MILNKHSPNSPMPSALETIDTVAADHVLVDTDLTAAVRAEIEGIWA